IVIEDLRALAQYFAACGNHYDEAIAVLTLAEAFCAAGDRASALPHIQRALDLSERFDYEYWLRGEIRRNPDLFAIDEIADRIPA
ncbi:hypothetical protein OFC51_33590, partial [Escherichia coli]|nr:hypothetical protein [Escherichia coli]